MPSKKRLVGRHHVLSSRECDLHAFKRGSILATDQLDKNVDVAAARERGGIVKPFHVFKIDAAVFVACSGGDGGNLDPPVGFCGDGRPIFTQQQQKTGADGAKSCDAQSKGVIRFHAASCRLSPNEPALGQRV